MTLFFVTAFWFVIHVCDSSFENSIERTLSGSKVRLWPRLYMQPWLLYIHHLLPSWCWVITWKHLQMYNNKPFIHSPNTIQRIVQFFDCHLHYWEIYKTLLVFGHSYFLVSSAHASYVRGSKWTFWKCDFLFEIQIPFAKWLFGTFYSNCFQSLMREACIIWVASNERGGSELYKYVSFINYSCH